jgi:hypothetical protein
MFYVGLDIHDKRIAICVLSETGQVSRRGELASNRSEDHEVSILALHLLQNCMIYVNTHMLQKVLVQPYWRQKLEARDLSALTPLIWEYVNPYGRFELDMNARIPLD